ncbi:MAG: dNTP triphosphohydrolase [bacterium]|nr:dNTP triphosphohydrolase [bacterium]
MPIDWMKKDICTYKEIISSSLELKERAAFLKDYGSIIYRSQFRRLSNKTQVFLNPKVDFPRTRLTHSIEVEQVGRELARFFANLVIEKIDLPLDEHSSFKSDFEDLVAAACLAHDLGQAPFGHRGEKTLSQLMEKENGINKQDYFEANKQNIRILIGNEGRKPYGVTCALIDSIMKYKSSIFQSVSNKYPGCYSHESRIIKRLGMESTLNFRNPACYIMEAADDIAYISSDLQDALKLNLINDKQAGELLSGVFLPDDQEDINIRSWNDVLKNCAHHKDYGKVTSLLIKAMLSTVKSTIKSFFELWCAKESIDKLPEKMDVFFKSGSSDLNILYFGEKGAKFKELKSKIYNDHMLKNEEIARNEFLAKKVITDLWDVMKESLICSENYENSDFFKMVPKYVQQNIKNAHSDAESFKEQKFQYLSDYISGMTDRYAVFLWSQLFDPSNLRFI